MIARVHLRLAFAKERDIRVLRGRGEANVSGSIPHSLHLIQGMDEKRLLARRKSAVVEKCVGNLRMDIHGGELLAVHSP